MLKKKIALLTTSFGRIGGVATVSAFLYRHLQSSDKYAPDVISVPMPSPTDVNVRLLEPRTWFRGVGVRDDERNGIPFCKIGAVLSEFEFQRYRPRPTLTRELEEYDLVQVVAGSPIWAYLTKHVSVPVTLQVATLTSVEREGAYSNEPLPLRLWRAVCTSIATRIEQQVPSMVDGIFVENQWMYEHYRQNYPDSNVYFAPPGVDISTYHPVNGIENENRYILSVGVFSRERKNVKLLFQAYHQLRQKISDPPRLVLAGREGPNETAWETAKSLGITEHVDVQIDVSEKKLTQLYRNAALFTLSSKEEGLGLVIAEAMASGVPVVSTDCGGPSTLIKEGETGYLTPTGDPDALADRMQRILENPDHARELGERGRERIEERFSERAAGERFLEVYDQLLFRK